MGGDPEQDYFVDGVHRKPDDRSLAHARNAGDRSRLAFTYKGKAVDLKQIEPRRLNVRYVWKAASSGRAPILVNVQTIDAETCNHLWAERFDKPLADLFGMQDEIVARMAGALEH